MSVRQAGLVLTMAGVLSALGACSKSADSKSNGRPTASSPATAPGHVPCRAHTPPVGAPANGPSSTTMTFAVFRNGVHLSDEQFTQTVVRLGRLASSHIVLEEPASRIHALIEIEASGAIMMNDLGSDLGTLVNGTRTMREQLKDGDAISIGDTRLVLALGERDCQP